MGGGPHTGMQVPQLTPSQRAAFISDLSGVTGEKTDNASYDERVSSDR